MAMALMNCPHCEEKIQDNQFTCTNCGYTLKDMEKGESYNLQGLATFDAEKPESYEPAIEMFRKSAENHCDNGQINLGTVLNLLGTRYYNGDGVSFCLKSAEKCFKESADLGNENAKKNIATLYLQYGEMYSNNKKVRANLELAEEYYKKATEYNPERCKRKLIKFYINCHFNFKHGIGGTTKDPYAAQLYLQKAKDIDSKIVEEIGQDYYSRAKEMLSQGVTKENYRRINAYLKKASHLTENDLTDDLIQFYKSVAVCSKKGKSGFKKNMDRSNRYYGKAAALGDTAAMKMYKEYK